MFYDGIDASPGFLRRDPYYGQGDRIKTPNICTENPSRDRQGAEMFKASIRGRVIFAPQRSLLGSIDLNSRINMLEILMQLPCTPAETPIYTAENSVQFYFMRNVNSLF